MKLKVFVERTIEIPDRELLKLETRAREVFKPKRGAVALDYLLDLASRDGMFGLEPGVEFSLHADGPCYVNDGQLCEVDGGPLEDWRGRPNE